MKMEGNLTKGPILKTLTKLAVPIMASSFLGTLYNITDMAWIGLLGSWAVAGVGVGGMFTWLSQRKNCICHSHKCSKLYCCLCKSVCPFSVSTSDTLCHMHLSTHSSHSCKSLRKPGKHTSNTYPIWLDANKISRQVLRSAIAMVR